MIERDNLQEKFPFLNIQMLHERLNWSIRLRWFAILGYFCATGIAWLSDLKINYYLVWYLLLGLAVINLLYFTVIKIWKDFSFRSEVFILHIHILVDLVFLVFILHYSGGIENPAFLFYIFHVVLTGILFTRYQSILYAVLVILLFSGMVLLESHRIISHDTLFDPHIYKNDMYIWFMITVFSITVLVTSYICTGFMKVYRMSKRIIDKQYRELMETDKQKTAFFRFTSHELKSPVIAIKSTLDVVLKGYAGNASDKIKPLLKRAAGRSEQMLEMITELLQLTNLRSHTVELDKDEIEIVALIEELISQNQVLLKERNIQCDFQKKIQALLLSARKEDIQRIFGNLISNAIRYGKDGGKIEIILEVTGKKARISIRDDGIGISQEDQSHIFEEFFRSANAREKINYGTGLGLSLVKQLVDQYKGNISVESKLNAGTTFVVELPGVRSQ